MDELIQRHRDGIAALCRAHGVARLHVVGSAARGAMEPSSDVDLLVEFRPEPPGGPFAAYMGLKEGLERLLGRGVDLITPGSAVNPVFRASIEAGKVAVYAAA